jgi:formate dehydrogenase subunit delta
MPPEKLIHMANQIAKFFAHQSDDSAVAAIADHLTKFWDPRMRTQIVALVNAGPAPGLDARALRAVLSLATRDA